MLEISHDESLHQAVTSPSTSDKKQFILGFLEKLSPFCKPDPALYAGVLDEPLIDGKPAWTSCARRAVHARRLRPLLAARNNVIPSDSPGYFGLCFFGSLIIFTASIPLFLYFWLYGLLAQSAFLTLAWGGVKIFSNISAREALVSLENSVKAAFWTETMVNALSRAQSAGLLLDDDLKTLLLLLHRKSTQQEAHTMISVEDTGDLADVAFNISQRAGQAVRAGDKILVSGTTSELLSRVTELLSADAGPRELRV